MNEILAWASLGIFGIIVMSKIPGLEHFVKPIIDLIFTGIKFIFENAGNWFIWAFKLLLGSHLEVFRHLTQAETDLDPSHEVRSKGK